jgi:hypothetical protein
VRKRKEIERRGTITSKHPLRSAGKGIPLAGEWNGKAQMNGKK